MTDKATISTRPGRYSTGVLAVVLVAMVVISLVAAKFALFPEHPDSWYRIHGTHDLLISEVRDILSQSGAKLDATGPPDEEVWRLLHRYGQWTVSVTPDGHGRLQYAHVRYYSSVFPGMIRMRNYPNP